MGERFTGYHPEGAQTQQPPESTIIGFCNLIISMNTRVAYSGDLKAFSRFATGVGVSGLEQLTPGLIDKYFEHCKKQNLSRATIDRRTASVSGLLLHSEMQELAKKTRDIGNKYIGSRPEAQPLHSLSADEVEKLQEVSRNNPRASAIIAIALGTGSTLAEIRALNVNDILGKEGNQVAVVFRGKKSKREITLDVDSSAIVRRYKGNREGENLLFARKHPIKRGEDRLSPQSILGDVKQYAEKIGRSDLNLRVLRQTFIMNVRVEDSRELAKLLGVGGRYAHGVLLIRRSLTQPLPETGVLFEA